ncbi:antitoxin VbhA family protein [Pseudomonas canadensis]|uniref:antitoxin VbhA family protein n=1 Tax=Pseudomonas canadensis TaxID=915099 RepID=UPI00336AA522
MRYARATSALEGIRPTELLLKLQTRFLGGEITIEESNAEARRHYGLPVLPEPLSRRGALRS